MNKHFGALVVILILVFSAMLFDAKSKQGDLILEKASSNEAVIESRKENLSNVGSKIIPIIDNKTDPNTKITETGNLLNKEVKEPDAAEPKKKGRKYKVINGEVVEVFDEELVVPIVESVAIDRIKEQLLTAAPEYKEFISKRLLDMDSTEPNDKHNKEIRDLYEQDVDKDWATQAEYFLNTYYATQPAPSIKLFHAHCRNRQCEILGRYFPYGEKIDLSEASSQISYTYSELQKTDFFRANFHQTGALVLEMPRNDEYASFHYLISRL